MVDGYIKTALEKLGIHKTVLASKMGVTVKTIENWARDEDKIIFINREKIDSMVKIHLLEKENKALYDEFLNFTKKIELNRDEDITLQKDLMFKLLKKTIGEKDGICSS